MHNIRQRSWIWQPGAEFLYIINLSECYSFIRYCFHETFILSYVKLQFCLQSYCSEQLNLHLLKGPLHSESALDIKNFQILEADWSPGKFSNPSHFFWTPQVFVQSINKPGDQTIIICKVLLKTCNSTSLQVSQVRPHSPIVFLLNFSHRSVLS